MIKQALLVTAAACCVTACFDGPGHVRVAGAYGTGGSAISYMYDSAGYPIYGYLGGRPVYAYDTFGNPVYSINLIRSNYYVPNWGPAKHYHGHYVRPHNTRPIARPPVVKPQFRPQHWNNAAPHQPAVNHKPAIKPVVKPSPSKPVHTNHRGPQHTHNHGVNVFKPQHNHGGNHHGARPQHNGNNNLQTRPQQHAMPHRGSAQTDQNRVSASQGNRPAPQHHGGRPGRR